MFTPSPESLNSDFSAIKSKKDNDYQNNQSVWNVFWNKANLNVRTESGDPTIMSSWTNNPSTLGNSNFYLNRTRPICLMLSGYQRRNRKSTVVVGLTNSDQKTSDQYTKMLMTIYKKENVYELLSEAFYEGPIISGMNMMQVYLDFTNDPLNGDIKFRNLSYSQFMIDPYWKEPDLSDANFILVRSYLPKPVIAHMMPPHFYEQIMALEGNQQGSTVDGRFQYQAAAQGYAQGPKLAYDEYFYRDWRNAKILYDIETGETMDVTEREDIDLDLLLMENPSVRIQEKLIPTVRLCVTIQDQVFYDGVQPTGLDTFPFVPFLGYYNKTMPYMYNRIQSVVTSLIAPQILFNRRVILTSDYLESVVSSGWMFREGAVLDPKLLLQTGAGRLIPIKNSATPLVDVVPIPAPQAPESVFMQAEVYDKEMFNVIGLSQENLGKVVEDDASGYQTALRTAAGLTAQQPLFDRFDLSQNMLGNLVIKIVTKNFTPGKVKRYLEGEEPAPQFYDQAFGEYHCVTELGQNTETQKQLQFLQLLELRKNNINIPDSILINTANLQNKNELIELMEKESQYQRQVQEMQMQIQQQEIQSRIQLSDAQALAHIGTYNERNARVAENRALAIQKIHEANANDAKATLDKVKAIKEIEALDLAHIEKLVAIAQALKMTEQAEVENEVQQAIPKGVESGSQLR